MIPTICAWCEKWISEPDEEARAEGLISHGLCSIDCLQNHGGKDVDQDAWDACKRWSRMWLAVDETVHRSVMSFITHYLQLPVVGTGDWPQFRAVEDYIAAFGVRGDAGSWLCSVFRRALPTAPKGFGDLDLGRRYMERT